MKLLIDPAMPNHPKVRRLAAALEVNAREARGIILALWAWTMTYHENGSLAGVSASEIATAADWPEDDAEHLLQALLEVHLLDRTPELAVHDWLEEQGALLTRREKERRKKARQRARRRGVSVPSDRVHAVPPSEADSPMKMSPGTGGTCPPGTGRGTSPSSDGQGKEGQGKEGQGEGKEQKDRGNGAPVPRDIAKALVDLWNYGRRDRDWIRLTPIRIRKVDVRLRDGFTEEQLRTVVMRLRESAFHQGENDRRWRAPGPEWVLASTERVEQWLAKNDSPTAGGGNDGGSRNGQAQGGNGSGPGARSPARISTEPVSLSVGAGINRFIRRPSEGGDDESRP